MLIIRNQVWSLKNLIVYNQAGDSLHSGIDTPWQTAQISSNWVAINRITGRRLLKHAFALHWSVEYFSWVGILAIKNRCLKVALWQRRFPYIICTEACISQNVLKRRSVKARPPGRPLWSFTPINHQSLFFLCRSVTLNPFSEVKATGWNVGFCFPLY